MEICAVDVAERATELRGAMVDRLRRDGSLRSGPVEEALRAAPRHVFVPEASVEEAYDAGQVIVTKRHADGTPLSSASEPGIMAMLLEQSAVGPGQRVLEIGAGTGYNAALLSHLVGGAGAVTTIEYDAETAERARRALAAAGYANVRVLCGDGALGAPDGGPYDRVLVSTGAWDVPPAWLDQLVADGRLVVPLRLPGWSLSIAFEPADGCWRSVSSRTCSFIPMEGAMGRARRRVPLADDDAIVLSIEDDRDVDHLALGRALSEPRRESWTGVAMDPWDSASYDHLLLWLTTTLAGACKFSARPEAVERGRVAPVFRWGGVAVCTSDTLAYVTCRRLNERIPGTKRFARELGVIAHGPGAGAAELDEQVTRRIRTWDREHRSKTHPLIELHRAEAPGEPRVGAFLIEKRHTRLAVSWSGS